MRWFRSGSGSQPLKSIADVPFARAEQTHRLREAYGRVLLWILGLQLLAANFLMLAYAIWGVKWKIPQAVMQTWLGATVVEVIGLVYVVVSHLFPKDRPGPGDNTSTP